MQPILSSRSQWEGLGALAVGVYCQAHSTRQIRQQPPQAHTSDQHLWTAPAFSTSTGRKWLRKAVIGPARGIFQLLFLEGRGRAMGLFCLMDSEQKRWRGKEILGKWEQQVTTVVLTLSVHVVSELSLASCFYCRCHQAWVFGSSPSQTDHVVWPGAPPVTCLTSILY